MSEEAKGHVFSVFVCGCERTAIAATAVVATATAAVTVVTVTAAATATAVDDDIGPVVQTRREGIVH